MVQKSYAQFREDLTVLEFFLGQGIGYYVEVGANDGISGSNTALLEEKGWNGLLVEANPDLIPLIKKARPRSSVAHCAAVAPEQVGTIDFYKVIGGPPSLNGLSSMMSSEDHVVKVTQYGGILHKITVPATTLDALFQQFQVPAVFELLSIDVEGVELNVLQGLSLSHFAPRILLIEDNSQGRDLTVRHYLKQRGYIPVHRTGVNDWYVRVQDSKLFKWQRLQLMFRHGKWWIKYRLLRIP